jgi:nucleoside phosphorylase/ankyrin repeat protein
MHGSRSHYDYTVAWISALPLELAAARQMFDQFHDRLPQPLTDTNTYTLGSICGHNVVLACLPSGVYGTTSAATVVAQMRSTFPRIQYGLLVGIGGGAPSEKVDIRLGDVVVSKPTRTYGGVVQYDYGKTLAGGRFEQTGMLNRPPEILLTAVSTLQAELHYNEKPISDLVRERSHANGRVDFDFPYPGQSHDLLFEATYAHAGSDDTCQNCDALHLVPRTARASDEPKTHYGLIASANQVMKDGPTRDVLTRNLDILCFEMEAAGLMNHLPSIVIRGVCDYSDSHKNKDWQPYAALTAASYGRLLLSVVPVPSSAKDDKLLTMEEKECLEKLFLTDPGDDLNALKRRKGGRAPGTCEWILDSPEIRRWLGQESGAVRRDSNILWLHGNPGTGKSTMAITLAEELPENPLFACGDATLAYFFCDSSSEKHRTATAVLRGLLYQTIQKHPPSLGPLVSKYRGHKDKLFSSFDALWSVLMEIGNSSGLNLYCIVDALDECDDEALESLLTQLNRTFQPGDSRNNHCGIHILITSRPYEEIGVHLDEFPNRDLASYPQVRDDLAIFIEQKVEELSMKKHYSANVRRNVAAILEDKAEGTFLWAGLACRELFRVRSRDAVATLEKLPSGLSSMYKKMLDMTIEDRQENRSTIIQLLTVIVIARRPLTLLELAEACNLYAADVPEDRIAYVRDDVFDCRLLVVIQDDRVMLLHKSVKDFLTHSENVHVINEQRAHAEFVSRCIDVLMRELDAERSAVSSILEDTMGDRSFLLYCVQYWAGHAHSAGSEFKIQERHNTFFELESSARERWLDLLRQFNLPVDYVPFKFSIFHIAARWGIPSLIFHGLSRQSLCQPGNKEADNLHLPQDYLVNPRCSEGTTPLEESAIQGHLDVFGILLDLTDALAPLPDEAIAVAIQNQSRGAGLVKLLIDRGRLQSIPERCVMIASPKTWDLLLHYFGLEFPVSEEMLGQICYSENGADILSALSRNLQRQLPITKEVLKQAALLCDARFVECLLNDVGKTVPISADITYVALLNSKHGPGIIDLILARWQRGLLVLESPVGDPILLIMEQLQNPIVKPQNVAQVLRVIEKRGFKLSPSIGLLRLVAKTGDDNLYKEILRKGEAVTLINESILVYMAERMTAGMFDFCFNTLGNELPISAPIVEAAAANLEHGWQIIQKLVELSGGKLPVSRFTFSRAAQIAQTQLHGSQTLNFLLQHFRDHVPTSSSVVGFAAASGREGYPFIEAILDRLEDNQLTAEDDVIPAVIANGSVELLLFILNRTGCSLPITEETLALATGNNWDGIEMFRFLSHRVCGQLPWHEEVFRGCDEVNISPIFAQCLNEGIITHDMIHAAAIYIAWKDITPGDFLHKILIGYWNRVSFAEDTARILVQSCNLRILTNLLTLYDGVSLIDKETMQLAVKTDSPGLLIHLMIKDGREDLILTEELVETAAWNSRARDEAITFLLEQYGEKIPVSEQALVFLLLNFSDRNSTVARFLEEQPDTILRSPTMLKAAVAGGNRQIVARILQSYPVVITDEIFEAAAGNFLDDKEIICLLLAKSGYHITERMIQIASRRKIKILSFLLDETRDSIPISTDTLFAALKGSLDAVETLLRYPIDASQITEEVLLMAGRCWQPERLFPLLFDRFEGKIEITEKVVTAIIETSSNNLFIAKLLSRLDSPTTLTEAVLVAAAKSQLPTPELMELFARLLTMIGDDKVITEATFVAAAGNGLNGARIMQLLLSRRSDFEIPESVSKAAVLSEETNADSEVMELLLESKGDAVPITEEVLLAATRNFTYRYSMFRLLVAERFDSVRACLTQTLLLTIAASGDMMILSLLERRFGMPITTELRSICQLYIGAQSLLQQGVPPDTRSASGETPLWLAAVGEHDLIVKDLLATEAVDVDAVPTTGESALFKTVQKYNVPIVRLLLAAGANPNLARKDGKTVYDLAKERSYLRIMAIMREYGAK